MYFSFQRLAALTQTLKATVEPEEEAQIDEFPVVSRLFSQDLSTYMVSLGRNEFKEVHLC